MATTMRQSTIGWFVLATLLVVLGTGLPATAVDLSGVYIITTPLPCRLTVVQTGTALADTGSCLSNSTSYPFSLAGTVDPATGAFSFSGNIPGLCADLVCSGTGDGEESQSTCTSSTAACNVTLSATKCGNGVIDPLEGCDRSAGGSADCCSANCRPDLAGSLCTSDGNDCTADICDGAGTCTHVPLSPAECRRAAAGHSTCMQQLRACQQICPGRGQARRECRTACAERSTCSAPGAPIRILAYVATECLSDGSRASGQKLMIRRGNRDPVAVDLLPHRPEGYPVEICQDASGDDEWTVGLFQRLAVLPDGAGVVFEVTNEVSVSQSVRDLTLPERGFYFVRADGSGLRRLGGASRASVMASIGGIPQTELFVIAVSPNGRIVAFTDLGPGPDGRETDQVFALDIASGDRKQLSRLQASDDPIPPRLSCLGFLDDHTITFCNRVYTPELGIFRLNEVFTVPADGSSVQQVRFVTVPGGRIVPQFHVTSRHKQAVTVVFYPATPMDHYPDFLLPAIEELFLLDGDAVLQLTKFERSDTTRAGRGGVVAGQRVFFEASADPFGTNRDQYCQIFSIDTLGRPSSLRQLTHLGDAKHPSTTGCFSPEPGSCSINQYFADPANGTVVFTSNCDPVGENPWSDQLAFSMRPDGSGLRQVTRRSVTTGSDRTVADVELPGPVAYP